MNLVEILSILLGGLQSATGIDQYKAIAGWASLALKAWDAYGETSAAFQAIAARIQALKDAGWVLADILAEYATTEAQLQDDFDSLRGS